MTDLERIDGLFVGQLSEAELKIFEHAVKDREAECRYEGFAGLLGLARVRLVKEPPKYPPIDPWLRG